MEKLRIVSPDHFSHGRRAKRSFDLAELRTQNSELLSPAVKYGLSSAVEFPDSCIETQNSELVSLVVKYGPNSVAVSCGV